MDKRKEHFQYIYTFFIFQFMDFSLGVKSTESKLFNLIMHFFVSFSLTNTAGLVWKKLFHRTLTLSLNLNF